MKHAYIMTVAIVAALAAITFTISTASALEFLLALWLVNSSEVSSLRLAEVEGELLLESTNGGGLGIKIDALCSGIGVGLIGPESLGYGSELLTLGGVAAGNGPNLAAPSLLCSNTENCTEPEAWVNVPVQGEVELMVDGSETFFVGLVFNGWWEIQCLILGITSSELCEESDSVVQLTNEPGGTVHGEDSEAFTVLAGSKLGTCTAGGSETGILEGLGEGLITGASLSVSSG